jgi:hypothetical protein
VSINPKTTDRVVLVANHHKSQRIAPCGITIHNSTRIILAWETILNWETMGSCHEGTTMSGPNQDGAEFMMVESQQETFRVLP